MTANSYSLIGFRQIFSSYEVRGILFLRSIKTTLNNLENEIFLFMLVFWMIIIIISFVLTRSVNNGKSNFPRHNGRIINVSLWIELSLIIFEVYLESGLKLKFRKLTQPYQSGARGWLQIVTRCVCDVIPTWHYSNVIHRRRGEDENRNAPVGSQPVVPRWDAATTSRPANFWYETRTNATTPWRVRRTSDSTYIYWRKFDDWLFDAAKDASMSVSPVVL